MTSTSRLRIGAVLPLACPGVRSRRLTAATVDGFDGDSNMSLTADTRTVSFTVNRQSYTRTVPVRTTLADFLRHDLGLTGTHVGCEHGVCGACTILVDGRSARACLLLAVQADGQE